MTGVIVGKFYPPHRGHKFLIETALTQVDDLTIIVCDHPSQTISAELRAYWLQSIHPTAKVVISPDDLPDEPGPWASRTIEILGKRPDLVFTSEHYGAGYAAAMGCHHVLVDLDRGNVTISATMIRANPLDYLQFLEPVVRAHFAKRVVIIGVESTGKSTLAEALAGELKTNWVEEFGREYSLTKTDEWITEDFIKIANEQQRRENLSAQSANRVLICDTNAFATCIWHRRYMGFFDDAVEEIASRDRVDLYLFTMPDFEFVQDGTRDGKYIRHEMQEWFVGRLSRKSSPIISLTGPHEYRLKKGITAIKHLGV